MAKINIIILYCLIVLFSYSKIQVNAQTIKDFPIDSEIDEVITQRQQYYKISLDSLTLPTFLHIQTTVSDYLQPAFIYVSATNTNPSNAQRDFGSQEQSRNDIYLPQEYLKGKAAIYLGIFCMKDEGCSYHISNKKKTKMELKKNEQLTFDSNKEDHIYFTPIAPITEGSKLIMFYGYGGHVDQFNMDIHYKDSFIEVKRSWENGYSVIVDLSDVKYADKNDFIIHIKTEKRRIVTVGVKYIDQIQQVNLYEGVFSHIPVSGYSPLCYQYTNLINEHNYLLNTVLYIKNALFTLKSIDKLIPDPTRKIELRFSNYIEFTYNELKENYLCVEAIEKDTDCSLTFQLLDKESVEFNQRLLKPIVNGIQQKNFLPRGKVVHYRHWTYHSKAIKLNFHMTKIKGNAMLYSYNCDYYPFGCDVTQSRMGQLINEGKLKVGNEINMQMLSISSDFNDIDLSNSSKYLTVVHCQGELDCEYTIEIDNIVDSVELVEGASFNKPSDQGEVHYYSIKIFKPLEVKSIKIFLESIAGNADIEVYEDKERTKLSTGISYFAGSKEIVEIKPLEGTEKILGAYYISILSKEKSYYSLRYRVNEIDINEVPPGIMNTIELTKNEGTKVYSFKDRNMEQNSQYVITVKAVNCRVNLKHEGVLREHIKSINIKVSKYKPELKPYLLEMSVDTFDDGSVNGNQYCAIMLSGDEQSMFFPLVLIESNFYLQELTQANRNDFYLIPLVYNELSRSLIIEIEINVHAVLEVTVSIQGKEVISGSKMSSFKKFVLSKEIQACAQVPLCPVALQIELNGTIDSNTIPYRIMFKNSKNVPTYFRRNYMRNDEIFPADYQHFYSDIKQNESGEVVIKFQKGSGQVYSKIVRKDINEENADWNKRVKLPYKQMKDSLHYDYFQKKITFGTKETSQCKVGCEIYIAVISEEVFINEPTLTEYSIYLKSGTDVVTVPTREYVSGALNNNNDINYYQIEVPFDSDRIVVNFISPFGTMYVNSGITLPTPAQSDVSIAKGVVQHIIKPSDVKQTQFKQGDKLTIGVKLTEYVTNYSDYLFNFIPQKQSIVTYIEMRSDQPEICKTNKEYNNGCYFAIELPDYQKINFALVYALLAHVANKVEIYASLVDKVSFDSNPAEFIPADGYEFDSKSSIDSRYLLIESDRLHLKKDFYLVVYVKTAQETEFSLKASFNNLLEYSNLLPHKEHLYLITQGQTIAFNILGQVNHKIMVTNLVGNGTIKYNNNIEKTLDATIVLLPKNSESDEEFSITASSTSTYGILVLIQSLSYDSKNIEILPFNELNDIIYTSNFFPQTFFIEIPFNQFQCSLNIKFAQYEKESNDASATAASSNEQFDIKGYVVPQEFYFEKISQPEKEPTGTAINGVYLPQEHVGFVGLNVVKSTFLSKQYLYAKIQPAADNKNTYKKIETEVMSYSKSYFVEDFQPKKYFYSTIDSVEVKTTFIIRKEFDIDKFARIEFGDCSGNLTYSIESHEQLTYKNETYIIKSQDKKYGKHIIIAEFKEKNQLYFSVFANEQISISSSTFPLTYVIKYTTNRASNGFREHYIDKPKITNSKKDNTISLSWEPVVDPTQKKVNAVHNLKVYETKVEDYLSLKSICVLVPSQQMHQFTSDKNDYNLIIDSKTQFVSLSLIASFKEEEEEYLMAYYMEDIDLNVKTTNWVLIICVSAAVVIVIIAILFYFLFIKRKQKKEEEANVGGPLVDDN